MHCHVRCLSTAWSYPWSWAAPALAPVPLPVRKGMYKPNSMAVSIEDDWRRRQGPRQNAPQSGRLKIVQLLRTKS